MCTVKIINKSNHPNPAYQTNLSAGMDLHANIETSISLNPGEAQIRPRSGLALKHGITVLNSPGTIDADYRGEIKVLLINHGQEPFEIQNGERIAQMIVAKYERIHWETAVELNSTERGAGGYGSTGIKPA